MKIKLLLLLSVIVCVFASCVTPKDTNFLQESVQKDYDSNATLDVDYRIIPGDRLVLTIYTLDEDMRTLFSMYTNRASTTGAGGGENTLQPNVLNVYSDGTVKIPYLDKIKVEGLNLLEAKNVIESRFQEFSPNLTVELTLGNRYFSMLGAISETRIALPAPRINIFQALALGGVIDPFGDRRKVNIIRQTPDGTEVKTFDLRSADIVNSEYYYIQPNDVIYVQELSRTFFGRITSFTGLLGGLGLLTSTVGFVILIVNLTK
ncbi:MAG TPA: hypothetical protein DIT04_02585 [Dysgonomonas sp.]|nr:hypothetical protein [Dysgonomonas sp.]